MRSSVGRPALCGNLSTARLTLKHIKLHAYRLRSWRRAGGFIRSLALPDEPQSTGKSSWLEPPFLVVSFGSRSLDVREFEEAVIELLSLPARAGAPKIEPDAL